MENILLDIINQLKLKTKTNQMTTPIIYTGEQFRHLRKQKGITQEALSDLSGVTQSQISNWELGKTSPRLSTAGKLLEALAKYKSTKSDSHV